MQNNNILNPGRVGETPLKGLVGAAALSLLTITRRRLGVRQIPFGSLFAVVLLLLVLGFIGDQFWPSHDPLNQQSMYFFACSVFVLGVGKRLLSWARVRRGEQHSFSHGISYFNLFPARKDWTNRFIDPLLGFAAGMELYHLHFRELGAWLIFASGCLFKLERDAFHTMRNQQLDLIDSQVESGHLQQSIVGGTPTSNSSASDYMPGGKGLPTGIDDGLKAHIRRRR